MWGTWALPPPTVHLTVLSPIPNLSIPMLCGMHLSHSLYDWLPIHFFFGLLEVPTHVTIWFETSWKGQYSTLKPLKPTSEHHGRRGEDQGPEVFPGQQQQPAWLNSSSIKVCFQVNIYKSWKYEQKGSKKKSYLYIRNPWIPHKTILCLGGHIAMS
jgi:hypothetical protein